MTNGTAKLSHTAIHRSRPMDVVCPACITVFDDHGAAVNPILEFAKAH